jgi:predicted TIM-barrel fold metal-dependent hydrolase
MTIETLRFPNLAGLASLPWFALGDEGRLVLRDRSLGPIVDVHTHIALAYLRPMSVDLDRRCDVEHYLPSCCPIDLDVYGNRNFRPEDLTRMKRDLTLMSVTGRGMRATHTTANLVGEMNDLRVTHSVLLPIDLPAISDNAGTALREAPKTGGKIVPFGSVHPFSRDPAALVESQWRRGARGIKLHPNVQSFRPDAKRAGIVYRTCGELGIPVLWHCGPVGIEPALGRYLTQVRHYEAPIRENPRTTFILGHAGALQLDEAIALQVRYPNVVLETSSQSVSGVRKIVERADPDRVLHGSDWPFYHQGMAIAKLLCATEGRADVRHKVLWANAARLLRLE